MLLSILFRDPRVRNKARIKLDAISVLSEIQTMWFIAPDSLECIYYYLTYRH